MLNWLGWTDLQVIEVLIVVIGALIYGKLHTVADRLHKIHNRLSELHVIADKLSEIRNACNLIELHHSLRSSDPDPRYGEGEAVSWEEKLANMTKSDAPDP